MEFPCHFFVLFIQPNNDNILKLKAFFFHLKYIVNKWKLKQKNTNWLISKIKKNNKKINNGCMSVRYFSAASHLLFWNCRSNLHSTPMWPAMRKNWQAISQFLRTYQLIHILFVSVSFVFLLLLFAVWFCLAKMKRDRWCVASV